MGGGGPKTVKTKNQPNVPEWLTTAAQEYLGNIQDISGGFLSGANTGPFQDYVNRVQEPTIENYTHAVAPTEMSDAMKAGAFGGSGDATARMQNQYSLGHTLANSAQDTGFKFTSMLGNTIGSLLGPFSGATTISPNVNAQSKGF